LLRARERTYFASVRGVGSMPVPHQKFIRIATLNPGSPLPVSAGKPCRVEFKVAEPPSGNSKLKLRLRLEPLIQQVQTKLNDRELPEGQMVEGWLEFSVGQGILRNGLNELSLDLADKSTPSLSLLDLEVTVSP
jgi:hypothetical protein